LLTFVFQRTISTRATGFKALNALCGGTNVPFTGAKQPPRSANAIHPKLNRGEPETRRTAEAPWQGRGSALSQATAERAGQNRGLTNTAAAPGAGGTILPKMADLKHDPDAPAAAARAAELGYAPMDDIHAELDELLQRASGPGPHDWVPLLTRIDSHLRSHFEAEDRWMRETDFPPRDCHIDEHAKVLHSSGEVLSLAREGNVAPAPSFIAALADWFPGHADYLDSALAAWMCKRQFGGKPVVLHRGLAARRSGST
jgi:hemerythrin